MPLPGPIRSAAGSAAGALADAWTVPFADARSPAAARPPPLPGPWLSMAAASASRTPGCSIAIGRRADHGRDDRRHRIRLGDGRRWFDRPFDRADRGIWSWRPRWVGHRALDGPLDRYRALERARPLQLRRPRRSRLARPPPPPPPPGPGFTRNTSRAGVARWGSTRVWLLIPNAVNNITPNAACRKPLAVSGTPRRRSLVRKGLKSSRSGAGPACCPRSMRTARTASSVAVSPPSRDAISPDARSASASAIEAPAALAISRALKTS